MISPASKTVKFTQHDIKMLFARAKRVLRQPGLDILLAPSALPQGRLLLVTSRFVGNAPERNKIRRRLKAIFHEERLFERQYDCIIIVKKGGISLTFDTLHNHLLQAYERAPQKATHAK
jgi:ribonuclease P protein component